MNHLIIPEWPAPAHVHAYTTLRTGGVSKGPYDSFNLGESSGDDLLNVQSNRNLLKEMIKIPSEPVWLNQTHSTIVHLATPRSRRQPGDASYSSYPNQVCVVLTADCLPVLICDRKGSHVAAIHAGWRGLAKGIIETTLKTLNLSPNDLLVWLGPAIGPTVYEVSEEVRQYFITIDIENSAAFTPSSKSNHWLLDLYAVARLQLKKNHIKAVYGGDYCTYTDKEKFFSYRRDGMKTGRMASLIWFT